MKKYIALSDKHSYERIIIITMKKCLILGAGGFIGKALCQKLHGKYEIIAYDRAYSTELERIGDIRQIIGDFTQTRNFTDILQGVDTVVHLISTTLPSDATDGIPEEIINNIVPTTALLESMVKTGVRQIIFSSSGGTVYGDTRDKINTVDSSLAPICSYGVQKKVIEAYIEFYGVRYTLQYKIARISNPYGIGQDAGKPQGVIPIFIRKLLEGEPITIFGEGTEVRDYIYMDDLMNFLDRLIAYEGDEHIFNIATGKVYSLHEIIEKIQKKVGRRFSEVIYKDKRFCDVKKSLLDVETTWDLLQYRPQISLDDGIATLYRLLEKQNG